MAEKRILPFSPNMMFPNYILGLSEEEYKEWLNKRYGMNKEEKKDEK
nr:MAG TPA: hypothetical protein [Caudoviricetes sp.]